MTNIVILCGGVAYYWCSIVNGSSHNTAVWLQDSLVRVLTAIKAEGLMFTAMVADNERVNKTLWELLLVPFPFLIRSPCAAHLIQLCINCWRIGVFRLQPLPRACGEGHRHRAVRVHQGHASRHADQGAAAAHASSLRGAARHRRVGRGGVLENWSVSPPAIAESEGGHTWSLSLCCCAVHPCCHAVASTHPVACLVSSPHLLTRDRGHVSYINKALELPLIEPLFTSMESLLREFRLKEPRLKLKNLQVANPLRATNASGIPVVYSLLRPQDTRWSSWLYAAQRLLMLRAYVDMVQSQDASFWSGLDELVRFLKPFQVATDVMQQDTSNLFDVWRLFKRLLTHVRAIPSNSLFSSSKDAIITIIIDMWEKHINIDAIIVCAQLSFDSSVEEIFPDKIQDARRWFLDFAAHYALYWHIADSSDTDFALVRRTALREWAAFLGRTQGTSFDHLDTDIEDLRKEHAESLAAFPRAVWNLYLIDAPIISHAAVAILSVCGSEAAVERTFSAQGLVHTDLRNRLGDATVEAEMFIKFNQRTLSGVEGVRRKA